VLVKGATGAVITVDGRPIALMGFTVTAGKMTTSDIITDTEHPAHIDLGTTGD
jgi:RNA polymerase sigma-70 factor, ECF subfamily